MRASERVRVCAIAIATSAPSVNDNEARRRRRRRPDGRPEEEDASRSGDSRPPPSGRLARDGPRARAARPTPPAAAAAAAKQSQEAAHLWAAVNGPKAAPPRAGQTVRAPTPTQPPGCWPSAGKPAAQPARQANLPELKQMPLQKHALDAAQNVSTRIPRATRRPLGVALPLLTVSVLLGYCATPPASTAPGRNALEPPARPPIERGPNMSF